MPTCQGKTKDGRSCSRMVADNVHYCWQHKSGETEAWREIYKRLALATPEEKTDIVLRLIEEHPEGRLELPVRDGVRADLSRVDLSPETLRARLAQLEVESAPWWSVFHKGVNLRTANLRGADLAGANLCGADLDTVNLQGANLEHANLQVALLMDAHLQGVQMEFASLQGSCLSYANLQGACLWGANLQGASLEFGVNLQGADLHEANIEDALLDDANLQGSQLEDAVLQNASLECANLQDANLRGANLQGAILDGANLHGAKLHDANLQDANLPGANLQGARLGGANLQDANLAGANLKGADLPEANLQCAILAGADLRDAYLEGANLQCADLVTANLKYAQLSHADLRGTYLWSANLHSATLTDAKLQEVDLTDTSIAKVYISGAWLGRTRLRREQLGGAIGEELDGKYGDAKQGYLALKQNFDGLGDYDAASWAYRKERRMEKLEALQKAKAALSERKWWPAIANGAKVAGDQLVELLCDYGESVWRVLFWMAALLFAIGPALLGLLGGLEWTENPQETYFSLPTLWQRWVYVYFQNVLYMVDTFTTADFAELGPANDVVRLFSGFMAIVGIFLAGLLGFVAGNRIRRS